MNRLPLSKRTQILGMLVEGNSLRATSRLADVSINTVTKLLVDVGSACAEYHYGNVRNIGARRVQCNEIWCFIGAKRRNVSPERKAERSADTWTWVALDADTRVCISYLVGGRGTWWARELMNDCASRVKGRVQITTDGQLVYMDALEEAFGAGVNHAQLREIYDASDEPDTLRCPAGCSGSDREVGSDPDQKHLPMRVGMRRFTRPTDGFSKKVENYAAMVAIHFLYYNFGRIHKTLRLTPSMAASLTDHVWSPEEIVLLAD